MKLFDTTPEIEIVTASGMLRVTLRSKVSVPLVLLEAVAFIFFDVELFRYWSKGPVLFRVFAVWVLVSAPIALLLQVFSGVEVIEFDTQKLTVLRDFHSWERRREYSLENCSELDWARGSEGTPESLRCKIGWKTIRFGKNLSEEQAAEILGALRQALPDVARRICAGIGSTKHFITLDLR